MYRKVLCYQYDRRFPSTAVQQSDVPDFEEDAALRADVEPALLVDSLSWIDMDVNSSLGHF
jgi:hypothetical protein